MTVNLHEDQCTFMIKILSLLLRMRNTGLFISSSGISELDCATTKTDTNRSNGPMGRDGLFVSQRTGSHSAGINVPFTNCFVCTWFCVVHDPKRPLHSHNSHSFGKFQDTERFIIHCERHFSSCNTP